MSAVENTPDNLNYLSQLGFRFLLEKLPNVNYFCQSANIPAISVNSLDTPTPFTVLPHAGSRITFEPLLIKFIVDEDLKNYQEVYDWLIGLGRPDSFEDTKNLARQSHVFSQKLESVRNVTSDGTLFVLNSNKRAKLQIFFTEMFPVALSELSFNSTDSSVDYLTATVEFRYRRYKVESI